MIYISPFTVFAVQPAQFADNWEAIKRQQQHFLQGFGLYSDATINGITATKQQFNKWMDELDDPSLYQIHLQIYENQPLLGFISGKSAQLLLQDSPAPADEGLKSYIKPYYLSQFVQAWLQAIEAQNEAALNQIKSVAIWYEVQELQNYLYPIEAYLKETISELQKLAESPQLNYISERELLSYISDGKIAIYNFLPDYLSNARNWLAKAIGQLAVYMSVQLGRTDGATVIMRQALKLHIKAELKAELEQLLQRNKRLGRPANWVLLTLFVIALLYFLQYLEHNYF